MSQCHGAQVRSFQPWLFWESPFPNQTSSDSPCISFSTAECSCSCTCKVLEKIWTTFFYHLCHSTDSLCPTSALQPYHKHLGGLMSSINNCLQNSPTFIVVNDWVAPHWDCRKGLIQTSYSPICPIWGCKIRNMFFGNNKGNHNERAKCVRSEHLFILISRGLTKAKANFCICKTLKLC